MASPETGSPQPAVFPESTYRLQFHAHFTFADAARILPYLRDLGITHVYASPILKAARGSTHGYDVVDPRQLNPELGSPGDFQRYVSALHELGMRQIADIVPNHMGVGGNENAWWNDVLEKGPESSFAGWFDVAWRGSPRAELRDKVLLPALGQPYGDALEKGELKLILERGGFFIQYYSRRFPVAQESYRRILSHDAERLSAIPRDGGLSGEYEALLSETDLASLKAGLASLVEKGPLLKELIFQNIAFYNGTPGDAKSFDPLNALLDEQHYRLACWRTAPDEINYRRFFDINDLAALCMERADVFDATHGLVFELIDRGAIAGLRIDHPDGVFDPAWYFRQLQRDGKTPLYVVVEKILATGEALPQDWVVQGTTGYDFINAVNGLFIDSSSSGAFTQRYNEWVRSDQCFSEIAYQKKKLILEISLASELTMLAHQLDRLCQRNRHWRDHTLASLRKGLAEVIACFPVYRSYISAAGVSAVDERHVETAIRAAIERNALIRQDCFDLIRDVLLLRYPQTFGAEDRAAQLRFVGKFQQVTAPVMAKGIEDTAFYIYNRFISLNEVGGDPDRFGVSSESLHRWMIDRQQNWPHALSPLSTHDTKRSEDVRARLNALSEVPDEWWQRVARWSRQNEPFRKSVDGIVAPDPNEELLIYQTLIGTWPIDGDEALAGDSFAHRIRDYLRKALREAKIHSSWADPREDYESAVAEFVAAILDPSRARMFVQDFHSFQRRISHYGLLNSLAQTVLKLTTPGVPDTYQGTELWDFSLVDPDNRRPVDYERRQSMLADLTARFEAAAEGRESLLRELIEAKEDGRIKLALTLRVLKCRRENAGLFSSGDYLPLEIIGERREHLFAFLRRSGNKWALVAIPRLLVGLCPAMELPLGQQIWGDTRLLLPPELGNVRWKDVMSGKELSSAADAEGTQTLSIAELFQTLPMAIMIA